MTEYVSDETFELMLAELTAVEKQHGRQSVQASDFYFAHLFQPSVARAAARLRESAPHNEPIGVLVSTMGRSPATTILAAAVWKPDYLHIIYGDGCEDSRDRAHDELAKISSLRRTIISDECVDPLDLSEQFGAIRRAVLDRRRDGRVDLIDITGGKKIMSAIAAQAAWDLTLDLCYIETALDPVRSGPKFGTESVEVLRVPRELKASRNRVDAHSARHAGDFGSAVRLLDDARKMAFNPRADDVAAAFSELGRAVQQVDRTAVRAATRRLDDMWTETGVAEIGSTLLGGSDRAQGVLRFGRLFASSIDDAERPVSVVLATLAELALAHTRWRRPDFAALLAYRAVEYATHMRLAHLNPTGRFDGRSADWRPFLTDGAPDAVLAVIRRAKAKTGFEYDLPSRGGLFANVVMLIAVDGLGQRLDDPDGTRTIGQVRGFTTARNTSYLTHGTTPISAERVPTLLNDMERLLTAVLAKDLDGEVTELRHAIRPLLTEPFA